MSGYAFHPDAFADLDEIWEYIAQDNVDAADRVLADIHSTLTTLAGAPQIGHRRPDLTTRPLRFHVARDQYLVAYGSRRVSFLLHSALRRCRRSLLALIL
jgi:plasmid stabilization system protein ParE